MKIFNNLYEENENYLKFLYIEYCICLSFVFLFLFS